MNPEGIQAQNPGLRGTSYPGSRGRRSTTPKGLRLGGAKVTQPRWGWNRCALGPREKQNNRHNVSLREQLVGSQPWARRRNPVGIAEVRISCDTLELFLRTKFPKRIRFWRHEPPLSRLRGRSRFGAAKALPWATLSPPCGVSYRSADF